MSSDLNTEEIVIGDYMKYDPEKSSAMLDQLGKNFFTKITSKDIEPLVPESNSIASGQITRRFTEEGVLKNTRDVKDGRKVYGINKSKINELGDVREKIIPQIKQTTISDLSPGTIYAIIYTSKLYVFEKTIDDLKFKGPLNDSGKNDVFVASFDPETFYMGEIQKKSSRFVKNKNNNETYWSLKTALNRGTTYALSYQNVYDLLRLSAPHKKPRNISSKIISCLKSKNYVV